MEFKYQFLFTLFVGVSIFNGMVSSHSQMRCAKYDKASGACYAPIRNQGVSFTQEAYLYTNGAPICQSAWTNPISSSYANGAGCPDWAPCPDAMGNFAAGETFTIMWLARNHAVSDQNPATIFLYLSPLETANQGNDVSATAMKQNLICSGPFDSCGGQNGNMVQCYLTCTMPKNLAIGIYTLWWKWDWQGVMYTTCSDINVKSGTITPSPPPTALTTGTRPAATTGAVVRSTTGAVVRSTTGARPATTGTVAKSTTGKGSTTAAVVPSSSSTSTSTGSSSSSSCGVAGYMKCASPSTYQTCSPQQGGSLGWSVVQKCPTGLSCNPSGNYVYCY